MIVFPEVVVSRSALIGGSGSLEPLINVGSLSHLLAYSGRLVHIIYGWRCFVVVSGTPHLRILEYLPPRQPPLIVSLSALGRVIGAL
jgi:hypothetical protein